MNSRYTWIISTENVKDNLGELLGKLEINGFICDPMELPTFACVQREKASDTSEQASMRLMALIEAELEHDIEHPGRAVVFSLNIGTAWVFTYESGYWLEIDDEHDIF